LLLPVESHDTIVAMSTGKGAVAINLEIIVEKYGKGDHMLGDLKDGVIELDDCHSEVGFVLFF